MEFIRKSSEEEMIAEFLRAEIVSERFGLILKQALQKFSVSTDIILRPNLGSEEENDLRKNVLAKYRDYGQNRELFSGFPKKVDWEMVALDKHDLEKIKYINYSYWTELSGGTRLAKDAVVNINKGVEIFNESNDRFFEVAKSLAGGHKFAPLILVSIDTAARQAPMFSIGEG